MSFLREAAVDLIIALQKQGIPKEIEIQFSRLCQECARSAETETAMLKRKHSCPEWDYMVIDEDSQEFEACLCYEGIDCTDEQLIEEVRRRGFVIRDAQIGAKWVGLTEDEVTDCFLDSSEKGILIEEAIEAKLKEKNA